MLVIYLAPWLYLLLCLPRCIAQSRASINICWLKYQRKQPVSQIPSPKPFGANQSPLLLPRLWHVITLRPSIKQHTNFLLRNTNFLLHTNFLLRNLYGGQEATVRTGHGTTDWFQRGKGVCQGCILSPPAYLTSMQSTSWEMLGWRKHRLQLKLPGEISVTSDMQMTLPLWQKAKKN